MGSIAIGTKYNHQRHMRYYNELLNSIGRTGDYCFETLRYYIAWRYQNSTIKSSTLKTEINNIRGACRRLGIAIVDGTQQTITLNELINGFSRCRGILDDSDKSSKPFPINTFKSLINHCFTMASNQPAYTTFAYIIALGVWGMLRPSEYSLSRDAPASLLLNHNIEYIPSNKNHSHQLLIKFNTTKTQQRDTEIDRPTIAIPCLCTSSEFGTRYCAAYLYNIYKVIKQSWSNIIPTDPHILLPNGKHISYNKWRIQLKTILKILDPETLF